MAIKAKKLYYSISEVSELTGIETHVLRFWESSITKLKPAKNKAGNRIYTEGDIYLVQVIRKLLWEKNYSIASLNTLLQEKPLQELVDEKDTPPVDDLRLSELRKIRLELVRLQSEIRQWLPGE